MIRDALTALALPYRLWLAASLLWIALVAGLGYSRTPSDVGAILAGPAALTDGADLRDQAAEMFGASCTPDTIELVPNAAASAVRGDGRTAWDVYCLSPVDRLERASAMTEAAMVPPLLALVVLFLSRRLSGASRRRASEGI